MKNTIAVLALLAVCTIAPAQVFLMDQIGTNPADLGTNADASQDFETANNAFDIGVADDFTTSQAFDITSVSAVFLGFNGFNSYNNITGYRVEIFSSLAAASGSLTGDVGSQLVSSGSANVNTSFAPSVALSALVTLPVSISLSSASTYWLSIIPVMDFSFGQVGTFRSNFAAGFPGGSNAFHVNPAGGFAFPGNQNPLLNNAAFSVSANPVPEPATMIALAGAVGALAARRRRKA